MQAAQGSQSAVRAPQERPQTGKEKAHGGEESPACISGVSYSQSSRAGGCSCPSEGHSLRGFEQPEPAGLGNARCPVSGFLLCLINFILFFLV